MRRLILHRLRGLVQVVDSIEAGRLDSPAENGGTDDISRLGRHLNRMTQSLDRSLRRLRQREAFLDAVINSADDGIVVVDDRLRIITANRAFEDLAQTRLGELVDTPCNCTRLCSDRTADECPARFTFDSGQAVRRIRAVTGANGRTRFFEVSNSPLRGATDGRQVLEVWRDITERREIEAHLANSERLASLGTLASGISHEINNPLASIMTCLDGLSRRLRSGKGKEVPEELPEYLSLIRKEVERCKGLTERFQVLGRQPRPIRESVDLGVVIRDIAALVRYEAEQRSARIEVRVGSGLGPLISDPTQVRQVVLNLVLNAIKSLDGPGSVQVTASSTTGAFVKLEVVDSGRGIEPENLQRIFEPFYSTGFDGRGTGLGLFISKIIVDELGGAIQVESVPGEGTRFTVLFPATSMTPGAAGP